MTANPKEIIEAAREDGMVLSLGTDGMLKIGAPAPVRDRWRAIIREHKAALIAELSIEEQGQDGSEDIFEIPPDPLDDRRFCGQCGNLRGLQCLAARRGEIAAASRSYEPVDDIPRRCEGYAPKLDDPDRRHGRERWPGLLQPS